MKKAAIIGMATFYLLLTTGMFVCIVHCAADILVKKPSMVMADAAMALNKQKHCDNKKPCDCCKKHGDFVIKENLKPGFELKFAQTAIILKPLAGITHKTYTNNCNVVAYENGKAPPGISGKLLSIQYRSLQI